MRGRSLSAPSNGPRHHRTRWAIATAACLTLVALLIWGFVAGRSKVAAERERERPIQTPLRVSEEKGEVVIEVDADAQARSGILVAPIAPARQRAESWAYGTVLGVQALADLYNSYSAATAQARKSRASLDASHPAYERLKVLHQNEQIVSTQVLQEAESKFRSDEASLEAAEALVRSLTAQAGQDWGPVIGLWMTEGSPSFKRILARQDVLVQVTLPPDHHVTSPPENVSLQTPAGPTVSARLVSSAARTDPRIQGLSFFCIAAANPGLLPGMNVAALLRAGPDRRGAIVPESAIVWLQGKAWVYEQTGPTAFARRQIKADVKATGGGYLVSSLPAGTRLVVRGPQALLSEEFRSQTAGGGEQDP